MARLYEHSPVAIGTAALRHAATAPLPVGPLFKKNALGRRANVLQADRVADPREAIVGAARARSIFFLVRSAPMASCRRPYGTGAESGIGKKNTESGIGKKNTESGGEVSMKTPPVGPPPHRAWRRRRPPSARAETFARTKKNRSARGRPRRRTGSDAHLRRTTPDPRARFAPVCPWPPLCVYLCAWHICVAMGAGHAYKKNKNASGTRNGAFLCRTI